MFRTDARKFELWERNIAASIGLGVALSAVLEIGISTIAERVLGLATELRAHLADIPGVEIWSPDPCQSGIIGFSTQSLDAAQVKALCADAGINVSTMADWDAPLDFDRRGRSAVVRAAPHYFNLESELETFASVLREAIR